MHQAESPLSEQAQAILQLIAAGRSYDQILLRYPDLSYQDIFAAAHEALNKLQASTAAQPATDHAPSATERPSLATQTSAADSASVDDETDSAAPPQRLPSFIERARQTHRRAWARWTSDEDVQLERRFRRGAHLAEIGQALGRHNGAIRSRLQKLGLIADEDDAPGLLLKPADAPPLPRDEASAPPPPRASVAWDTIRQRLEGRQEAD